MDNTDVITTRTVIFKSDTGLVEDLRVWGPPARRPRAESFSPEFQISLPYHGLCVWHVGNDNVVADPNQVKFIAGGEGYRVSRPLGDGHGEIIITIRRPVLAELLAIDESRLASHALFRRRSRPADPQLQYLGARWLGQRSWSSQGELAGEEGLIAGVRQALHAPARVGATPAAVRLVNRAKEYVAAWHADSTLRLEMVAKEVGVSPLYLSTLFTRVEGMPLHRYVIRLRLSRALVALPESTDLARLALDVGFSHHSHFTEAFRRTFGSTPSMCRAALRGEHPQAHLDPSHRGGHSRRGFDSRSKRKISPDCGPCRSANSSRSALGEKCGPTWKTASVAGT